MQRSFVSIIVLHNDRYEDTYEVLTRLRAQTWSKYEIIVIDNASSDKYLHRIHNDFSEVRLLEMTRNLGIEAYNYGFNAAHGEYLVVLEQNSFSTANMIESMVEKFENDPLLGIVFLNEVNHTNSNGTTCCRVDQSTLITMDENYLSPCKGVGIGIRRQVMEETGGFSSEFFRYWHIQDMAFRVLNADWKIDFLSEIVSSSKFLTHNQASREIPFYYTRNVFWLVWKHYPLDMALRRTLELIFRVFYHSLEQRTWVYLQAFGAAIRQCLLPFSRRRPVRREIARKLRIPLDVSFTFFR